MLRNASSLAFVVALAVIVGSPTAGARLRTVTIYDRQSPDGHATTPCLTYLWAVMGSLLGWCYSTKTCAAARPAFSPRIRRKSSATTKDNEWKLRTWNPDSSKSATTPDKGTLTANGPYTFDPDLGVLDSVLAVTGGTGKYKYASGEVMIPDQSDKFGLREFPQHLKRRQIVLKAGPAEEFSSLQFDFDFSP